MLNFASFFYYIGYIGKNFRIFYGVIFLLFIALFFEYLATSLLIPLAPQQTAVNSWLILFWVNVAHFLGFVPSTRLWLWLFFIVLIFRLVLGYLLTILMTWLGKFIHETLSDKVFSHIILNEPMSEIYKRSVGHYITLAGDDTFKSGTIITCFFQGLVGVLTSIIGIILLYFFSPIFFWGLVLFLGISVLFLIIAFRYVFKINYGATNLSRALNTNFIEALNSIRSLRTMHFENYIINSYALQIHRYVRLLLNIEAIKSGMKIFPIIALLFAAVIILNPKNNLNINDTTLVGGTLILMRVFVSLGQMMTAFTQAFTDIRAVKDIRTLIQLGKKSNFQVNKFKEDKLKSLELKNISFSYNHNKILKNLSFQFNVGRTYAIIGPSGTGKSTLADIILGLITPDNGSVIINNGTISLNEAKCKIVLVEQHPKIFTASLKENLLLGHNVDNAKILDVLSAVNLLELVNSLDLGLDTILDYQGDNFSGGQIQRLGIARALVRSPDILILDEATSALDPKTRIAVVKKLRIWMSDGIIIFITHDCEIAKLADKVLYVNKMMD
jgi:ATP-binding cassette subfamily B protein